ncbi:MAG: uracil phosphoribosyltransferase [Synergistaceae bacterium]|nr:uracil phosphoribosyltransferase [Synergistaceae bacterium]
MGLKIAVGCDHTGKEHLDEIKKFLSEKEQFFDIESVVEFKGEDYPEVALEVAMAVSSRTADRGILVCGTGIGMSIAANKIKGIRSAVCNSPDIAVISRQHNDTNVLAIGARLVPTFLVNLIVEDWLNTDFSGGRHSVRLSKIAAAEENMRIVKSEERVTVFDHPLVQHKVALIRDKNTCVKDFSDLIKEIAGLMVYEITRYLPTVPIKVETPLATADAFACEGRSVAIIPILRAGIGMVDGILQLIPNAKVGHIGLYRNPETLKPIEYFCKLPTDISEREIFILDPMLATGGTAVAGINLIKKHGGQRISYVCIIAAPEGIKKLHDSHPDVPIYTAALDSHIDDHGYIVPGLGDAGDRLFGTK